MLCGGFRPSFAGVLGERRNVDGARTKETTDSAPCAMDDSRRRTRRHLPVGTGHHTVGIVDIMCERGENGSFFRLYYPTQQTDIYASRRQAHKQTDSLNPNLAKNECHGIPVIAQGRTAGLLDVYPGTLIVRVTRWADAAVENPT
ncbi:hypothetical protein BaRGS_00005870 [Batillaria attramentaria]|uniref:Uncharacterized protein n=1 Tax=Batillaria attramentaria TaxID=370345 RepID=A0ABD0LV26_9CAEN